MICRIFCWICLTAAVFCPALASADCREAQRLYEKAVKAPDLARTIEYATQSLDKCPDFEAYYLLGKAYAKSGNLAEAEPAFRDALNIAGNPGARARALAALGQVYLARDDIHEAVLCFKNACKAHPYPGVLKKLKKIETDQANRGVSAAYIRRSLCANSRAMFGVEPSVDLHIHFRFDTAELDPNGQAQAEQLGLALNHPSLADKTVTLVGHTDIRGSGAYNLNLSEKRAKAVKRFLHTRAGVPEHRIITRGMGESQPLYPGDTEEDHALNRRVEVKLEASF